MSEAPFILFGQQHLIALALSVLIIIYFPLYAKNRLSKDRQETTAKIRKETDHLKGVKIGIMGCIVNGPGEMADADYGYVGTGVGQISLYKGYEVVERNIASEKAVDALINLIKKNGDWVELEE